MTPDPTTSDRSPWRAHLHRQWVDTGPGPWLRFAATAALVGVLTGAVAAAFHLALSVAAHRRSGLLRWAHAHGALGFVLFVLACAAATAAAAALVHRVEPHAEGSGIPRIEAIVAERADPGRPWILPIKFAGGVLAIGSGLALGREGPSVQMGGSVATIVSRLTYRNRHDLRILVAAGAAAGLATAFNAPIAGGVFILEELVKRFDPRTTVATLVASGAGFASAHLITGDEHDFVVPALHAPRLLDAPVVLAVGVLTGLLGVLYNRAILTGLNLAERSRIPIEVRAATTGILAAVIAWWWPTLVGGGDNLTQQALLGQGTLLGLCAVFMLRLCFGVASYAAATPGGLFAPMLVLGTHAGAIVALALAVVDPRFAASAPGLALIGMASFFTASVRAPVTGIILATEMTGSTALLAPMLGACAVAMLIAAGLRSEPIYDALAKRSAAAAEANQAGRAHAAGR